MYINVDPHALLDYFKAVKPNLLERFRVLKSDHPIGAFKGPKTDPNGAF